MVVPVLQVGHLRSKRGTRFYRGEPQKTAPRWTLLVVHVEKPSPSDHSTCEPSHVLLFASTLITAPLSPHHPYHACSLSFLPWMCFVCLSVGFHFQCLWFSCLGLCFFVFYLSFWFVVVIIVPFPSLYILVCLVCTVCVCVCVSAV